MVSGFFFNACWSSLLLPSSSNCSLSWHKNTSSFEYSNLPKKTTSLDVDMSDKRMNAAIQKGRNSSFVPAGSADFSNCPYRLAEREWDHWWTVGQTLDGIFVQRAICRKTSVYWPPPPPSEGTRGADTSCPSTPTWLSAQRTPSLPALCADTRGYQRRQEVPRRRQWRPFKGDIDTRSFKPSAEGSPPPGGCKSNKCNTTRCAWISPRRVYVRIPPIVYVLACNRVESGGSLSVNNKGENNPRRTTSTREKTLPQRQNHGRKMQTRCTFLPSNSLKTELHTGRGASRGHMTDWPTCYRTKT